MTGNRPALAFRRWTNRLSLRWCRFAHTAIMWPVHGQYQRGTCGRRHPIAWAVNLII